MTKSISTNQYGQLAAVFGIAAFGIYVAMIGITLNHIEMLAGLRPFDMRPGGYSTEQAQTLLDALGVEGRQYYLTRQIPLDLLYPALMALTLISALKWLEWQGINGLLSKVGIWFSAGAGIADYVENAGICIMLLSWPELPNNVVQATSGASIAKAGLTTLAVLVLIICLAIWASKKIRIKLTPTSPV